MRASHLLHNLPSRTKAVRLWFNPGSLIVGCTQLTGCIFPSHPSAATQREIQLTTEGAEVCTYSAGRHLQRRSAPTPTGRRGDLAAGIRHIWTPGGNAHSGHSGYSGRGRKIQIVYAKAVAPLLARLGGPYPSFTTAGIPDLELGECVSEAIVASTVNVDNLFNQSAVATRV